MNICARVCVGRYTTVSFGGHICIVSLVRRFTQPLRSIRKRGCILREG